jgi:hypothetical protein
LVKSQLLDCCFCVASGFFGLSSELRAPSELRAAFQEQARSQEARAGRYCSPGGPGGPLLQFRLLPIFECAH